MPLYVFLLIINESTQKDTILASTSSICYLNLTKEQRGKTTFQRHKLWCSDYNWKLNTNKNI